MPCARRLEIDNILYETLIPYAKRRRYEEGVMKRSSFTALTTPASVKVRSYYVWVLLLLNVVIAFIDYTLQVSNSKNSDFAKFAYYRLAIVAVSRAGVFGLAEMHSHSKTRAGRPSKVVPTSTATADVGRADGAKAGTAAETSAAGAASEFICVVLTTISCGATIGSAFFVYMFLYNHADAALGFALAPSLIHEGSTWQACLLNYDGNQSLSDLCNQAWQGTAGLNYFADETDADAFRRYGRTFAGLKGYYNEWWQLTYAAYYE